jgi:divalent metal cation (Fe/Co/Zn/Cd) transporter
MKTDMTIKECDGQCCTAIRPEDASSGRSSLLREALRLEWLTIAWMIIEASVSIAAGLASGSIILTAFGLDSVIELASAGVLLWRLRAELHDRRFPEEAERLASRIAGALLLALAAYIAMAALWGLAAGSGAEFSWPGFIVALAAIPAMRYLAYRKIAVAEQLGSRALRADAMEAVTCGWLSFVAVIGLGAQWIFGVWWIDGAGSLAIVWLLVKEGREAWSGQECGCCPDG